jgi:Rieske Fe-S protein
VSDDAPSRRAVLGGAVAVAAGIAGFFVAREQWSKATPTAAGANGYGAPASGGAGALLAPLSEVPAGGGVVLAAKGVVLTRGPDGAVHGFSSICTHQGCTLASVSGGTINCPCHGSKFNAQTGAVVNGPAARPLPTVAVVVRAGAVYRG